MRREHRCHQEHQSRALLAQSVRQLVILGTAGIDAVERRLVFVHPLSQLRSPAESVKRARLSTVRSGRGHGRRQCRCTGSRKERLTAAPVWPHTVERGG